MAESDRGLHPDLVEETLQERETAAATHADEQPRGRGRRRSSPVSPPPASADGGEPSSLSDTPPSASPESGDEQTSEPPDWRTAQSDEEAFKLLAKRLPSDALTKDETLSGLIGSRADLRAREILRQQQREALEQQKREAAANNDIYTLGELQQREYREAAAAQAAQNAGADTLAPFMEVVTRFQQTLPEAVQKDVAGKTFGENKGFAAGFEEYLNYVTNSAIKLGVEAGLRDRESALRKSVLSEVNGNEPVPEREGGTPSRVRVVTDEQIAAMSLAEYDALFDENGRPRPGVQHRSTRGIPLTRQ